MDNLVFILTIYFWTSQTNFIIKVGYRSIFYCINFSVFTHAWRKHFIQFNDYNVFSHVK